MLLYSNKCIPLHCPITNDMKNDHGTVPADLEKHPVSRAYSFFRSQLKI